jgi:hypothetical protein
MIFCRFERGRESRRAQVSPPRSRLPKLPIFRIAETEPRPQEAISGNLPAPTKHALFRVGLAERFPQGYRVAMPEMSCGFAFAKDLDGPDLDTTLKLIDSCYQKGTRPFSPVVYEPDDLLPV